MTDQLPSLLQFPFPASAVYEPPAEYERLRAEAPVSQVLLPTGDRAWLVSSWAGVRLVLSDPRFSRAAASQPDAPRLRPLPPDRSTILAMDPPEHGRLRRLVSPAFSARRTARLEAPIEALVDRLLSAMSADRRSADLLEALALPLPIGVICDLLGIPATDHAAFRSWADTMLAMRAVDPAQIRSARTDMSDYLAGLVASKRRNPGDDLLSDLVQARDAGDKLSEEELVVFGVTLLIAGYHTTSTSLLNAVVLLSERPELFAELAAGGALLTDTVEELLRLSAASASGGNLRVAVSDVEVDGVLIRAGDGVLPAIVSANRDGAVFADPDELQPGRDENPHLAFGHGVHYCLGAALARLELTLALRELSARFPRMRLAVPRHQLSWDEDAVIRRVRALPVTW